jgi:23S rRNA (guanosine2251-2'-O)-methyltransferase
MNDYEIIYGRKPVIEVARSRPIHRIWLTELAAKDMRQDIHVDRKSISIVSKGEISQITARSDHQGAAAEVDRFRYSDFEAVSKIVSGIILAADGITDPRNLGAVIRSATLLGVKGIIIPEKYSASITPVVCHASAGGTEHIAITRVPSLLHSIGLLGRSGFTIACADLPSESTVEITRFSTPEKLLLVLGSEKGLRRRVRDACDVALTIPQKSAFDSFNVSVAASIILWELTREQK